MDDVKKPNGEARHSSNSSPGTDTQRDVINLPRDVTPPRDGDKSTETEEEEEDFDEVTVCCCEVCGVFRGNFINPNCVGFLHFNFEKLSYFLLYVVILQVTPS